MFKDRVKAFMLIFVAVGLASFYDFLLFFDGHRSLLASFPTAGVPLVLFAIPYVAIAPHILSLFGSLYAPLAFAGLFVRASAIRTTISAVAVFQLVFAAVTFLVFGSLSQIEKAFLYIVFAVFAALWANGSEASKAFSSSSAAAPPSVSRSPFWVVSFVFSARFLLPAAFAVYVAWSWHSVRPPEPAVFERPRAVAVSGDYRTIYKYSVFVPAGYKMQTAASVSPGLSGGSSSASASASLPAPSPSSSPASVTPPPSSFPSAAVSPLDREFACVLTKGDDRIMITDNRGRLMDSLREFARFFYRADERDLLKAVVNERFGLASMAFKNIFRGSFAREAVTPYLSGFCSDGGPPPSAGARKPGYMREFTLWDGPSAHSVLAVFSTTSPAFDPAVMEAVVVSLRLEDRVKSAADYYASGVELYAAGRVEEAKYEFASALYYNFFDYASHYYIARCFRETGASDTAVMFHLNSAVTAITANRFFAGRSSLEPLASPADIEPALAKLSGLIVPSSPLQTPVPASGSAPAPSVPPAAADPSCASPASLEPSPAASPAVPSGFFY